MRREKDPIETLSLTIATGSCPFGSRSLKVPPGAAHRYSWPLHRPPSTLMNLHSLLLVGGLSNEGFQGGFNGLRVVMHLRELRNR